jgi:hypothetical protein
MMACSNDQMHSQMLELLVKIMDLEGRTRLGNQVFSAWTANDKNEMLKVLNALNSYLDVQSKSKKSTSEEEKAQVLWGYYI